MEFLGVLWLPILVSAVLVFVGSSVIHMALGYHKSDYRKLPDEANILEAMGKAGVTPGHYAFPRAESMKDMNNPDVVAKFVKGPVGFVSVMPSGKPGMGKSLTLWFIFSVIVSVFAAYIGSVFLSGGATYLEVFRLTGTVAFVGYGVGGMPESIWKGLPWSITIKSMIDGLIYALLTAGTFGWLWPGV